jgi:hypothetical protein
MQTDDYVFTETVRDKKPARTQSVLAHLIAVPVTVQYNFFCGDHVEISPSFTAYFSKDPYYNLNVSVSFGNKK